MGEGKRRKEWMAVAEIIRVDENKAKEKELIETGAYACINCRFWQREDPKADDGICRRFPPTVHAFPAKNPLGGMSFISQSFFPKCRPEITCGEFSQ